MTTRATCVHPYSAAASYCIAPNTRDRVAVGDWRRRVRLFHALRLLEDGAPVTEVALEVGYASTSAFSHAFARQFGRSPTGRTRAA